MIPQISWRNIWRHRSRSLAIMASVALGLWGGIFIISISYGVSMQRKSDMIYNYLSHIQVHHPEFRDDPQMMYDITDGMAHLEAIRTIPGVAHSAARTLTYGMISAPSDAGGVQVHGVVPDAEKFVTNIDERLVEGEYLAEGARNAIVIGKTLADKLNVGLRSKVVLTFQDKDNEIVAGAFRINGIFRTASSKFDEANVYVRSDDIARIIGTEIPIHEIAVLLADDKEIETVRTAISAAVPDAEVLTWRELSPELNYMDEMMDSILYIFIGVILFALAFGLVNTMLMAVLERTRELGMLMAVGMNKMRVFTMVLLETTYLAVIGAAVGMGLSILTIRWFERTGINIPSIQEGMAMYGMGDALYPHFSWSFYPPIIVMVLLFSVLAAIYPAIKALRLNPVEAIRKI